LHTTADENRQGVIEFLCTDVDFDGTEQRLLKTAPAITRDRFQSKPYGDQRLAAAVSKTYGPPRWQ
jgi:hypothetical protein